MRIISGTYRGKQIHPPRGFRARPTTDFAKESLFNILQNRYDLGTLDVLDLFAGTGSISYEFLSRGVRSLVCVEKDPLHHRFIRDTLVDLDADMVSLIRTDAFRFLKRPAQSFDLIFADPPFDHHLLVDEGAQRFARNMGFTIEDDLNTPRSRELWLEWKRRTDAHHYPDPESRAQAGFETGLEMVAEGKIDPEHYFGTINCNGVNTAGDVCGVTTTSGLAWKIPGRVGDSPILGAGLYVDNDVGAAGSTGRGEANLYSLASFLLEYFAYILEVFQLSSLPDYLVVG